jgi:sugar O-acyltransferase (sialic acid O-acetyltransferase NeuD family)
VLAGHGAVGRIGTDAQRDGVITLENNGILTWNGLPLVIFGTEGISKEVMCVIDDINRGNYVKQFNFLGYIAEDDSDVSKSIGNYKVVSSDNMFNSFKHRFKVLGVVIPNGFPDIKHKIYSKLSSVCEKLVFPNLISPKANVGDIESINFGIGNIICAGCTLTKNINIGSFNLFNINSTIGHDARIDDFCVVNPLASISGKVSISEKVLIGAGSTVLQGLKIGEHSIIGAGSVVVADIPDNVVAYGNPCKVARRNE